MMLFMVIVSIVAVVGVLMGLLAMLKAAELDQALRQFKKQQSDETDALKQRVESLSKAISGKENPFAASPAKRPPVVEKKPASAPRAPATSAPSRPSEPPPAPVPAGRVVLDEPEQDVNFDCPHCGQNIDAPASMAGFHVNCPTCSGLITIPSTSTSKRHAASPAPTGESAGGTGEAATGSEEILKGATVRIDISKMFDEIDNKPKRQVVIKRRR